MYITIVIIWTDKYLGVCNVLKIECLITLQLRHIINYERLYYR